MIVRPTLCVLCALGFLWVNSDPGIAKGQARKSSQGARTTDPRPPSGNTAKSKHRKYREYMHMKMESVTITTTTRKGPVKTKAKSPRLLEGAKGTHFREITVHH